MTIDFSLMISAESEAAAAARVVGVVVGVEELEAVAFRFGAFELTLLLPSVSKYGSLIVRPGSLNPKGRHLSDRSLPPNETDGPPRQQPRKS